MSNTTDRLSVVRRAFILLSDLHAHPWALFSKGDGAQNTRLRRSLAVLEASLAKAHELGIPWVFGGDIVHTAGHTLNVVMAELTDILVRYAHVEKIAVWGNHDARGVGGRITLYQTALASLARTVDNLIVLDPSESRLVKANGLTFSGAGYQPRPEYLEFGQESDVGVYHQTVQGSLTPFGRPLDEGILAEDLLRRHQLTVIGHVHHWQHVIRPHTFPGREILVPGSPEHHNFGDAGEHGWWIISVGDANTANGYTKIPGGSPEFRTVDHAQDVHADENFYRVRTAVGELPEGAVAIAPSPNAVESRVRFRGAHGDALLTQWLESQPPDVDLPRERFFTCAHELLVGTQDQGAIRPMVLKKVTMHNFCSHGLSELRVTSGVKLVLGRGRDYPSNGAGKSTMFEGVFWALFGRTTKGLTGDDVIRWGKDECTVRLDLVSAHDPSDWLTITRKRGGREGGLTVCSPSGQFEGKSVNEVTDNLSRHLGITPDLYQALAYFSQEKLLLFASATDGARKEMLADLIGLEMYQTASSAAGKLCATLEDQGVRIRMMRESLSGKLATEATRSEVLKHHESAWRDKHAQRLRAARDMQSAFDPVAFGAVKVEELRAGLVGPLESEIQRLQEQRVDVARKLAAVGPQDVAAALTAAQVASECNLATITALSDAEANARVARGQSTVAAAEYARYARSVELGQCPTCGQALGANDVLVAVTQARDVAARVYDAAVAACAVAREARVPAQAEVTRTQDAVGVAHQAAQWETEQQSVANQIARAQSTLATVDQRALEQANLAVLAHVERLHGMVTAVEAEINPHSSAVRESRDRIEQDEEEIATLNKQRVAIQEEISIADYWRRGFSKQGLQSILLDEVAAQFNDARGDIFPALTQGVYDVQFSTVSQTRAGDARERTEFLVYEHGQLVPYSALSGGQRRRVDVGVMLTLIKAVSQWMQVPGVLGMLVLDEVFGFLDASGAEGLLEALRDVQGVIPSVFVVSHDTQLQALFPDSVMVEQDAQGVSRIVGDSDDGVEGT